MKKKLTHRLDAAIRILSFTFQEYDTARTQMYTLGEKFNKNDPMFARISGHLSKTSTSRIIGESGLLETIKSIWNYDAADEKVTAKNFVKSRLNNYDYDLLFKDAINLLSKHTQLMSELELLFREIVGIGSAKGYAENLGLDEESKELLIEVEKIITNRLESKPENIAEANDKVDDLISKIKTTFSC